MTLRSPSPRTTWLSEAAAQLVVESARRAHPCETGGVLVGVLVNGRPWITSAVEVPSASPGTSSYLIPKGARHRAVAHARAGDHRVGYLGDWHSHPADVGSSPTDAAALMRVARNRRAGCPHPLLMVARLRHDGYVPEVLQVDGDRLVATQLIAAGALPPAEDEG